MRIVIAVLSLLAVGVAPAAYAQKEPLKPAPVPSVGPRDVTPADRAGRSNGDAVDAPFSGAPSSPIGNSGQVTPNNAHDSTRQSAPAPNLSR